MLSGVAVPTTPGGQQAVSSPASTPSSTVKTVTPGSEAQSKSPTAQGEDEIDGEYYVESPTCWRCRSRALSINLLT